MEQLSDQTGPLKFPHGIAVAAILAVTSVFAQSLSDAVRHIQMGEMDSARIELARLPADSAVESRFFMEGLMETDADSACQIYEQLVECYPHGRYTDDVLVRLAQHDFILGRFREGINRLKRLLRDFPASPNRQKAHYWIGLCYSNLGEPDSAIARFKTVIRNFPASDITALAQIETKAVQAKKVQDEIRYIVQVGAFGTKANAVSIQNKLKRGGFENALQTKTVDGRKLYVVTTGKPATKREADALADRLNRKFGWDARAVAGP